MSADDKRTTILRIFHESQRPFTLKEMEKLAAKAGVVQNTVKDILKDLTDDSLVDMDKIGATNWFWSFPSKEAAALRSKLKALQDKKASLEDEIGRLAEREQELLKDRPVTEGRKRKLEELETLKSRKVHLDSQLKEAKLNDPEETKKLQKAAMDAKAGADRWTDNTWSTMDWMRKKCGMSRQDAARQLNVSEDFDYVVFKPK